MRERKKSAPLDERQHGQIERASYHALLAGMLFDVAAMFYYFFARQMEKAYPYAFQLLLLAVVFVISLSWKGDAETPRTITGKKLDTSAGTAAFFKRLPWYALDAACMVLSWTLFQYYQTRSLGEDVLSTLAVSFLTVLIMATVIGEIRVRNWQKEAERMDREEQEE